MILQCRLKGFLFMSCSGSIHHLLLPEYAFFSSLNKCTLIWVPDVGRQSISALLPSRSKSYAIFRDESTSFSPPTQTGVPRLSPNAEGLPAGISSTRECQRRRTPRSRAI